mmetsp:Transcript_17772/g.28390  ORF Transcript_17772/g.28390 Transcript_17772/m.28390 type:complete len:746 (-) Transcript_17772:115-2352(-)
MSSQQQTPAGQGASLASVLVPAACTAAAYFIIFEAFRGNLTEFFAPRFKNSKKGRYPHPGVFSWIYNVYCVSDEELLTKSGFDAVVYVKFMGLCFKILMVLSILGLVILASIYNEGSGNMQGLMRLTLSNVEQKGDYLWAPAIMMWFFTGTIIYFIQKAYDRIIALRAIACNLGSKVQYTILVTKIPTACDTEDKIRAFLEPQWPGQIVNVSPVEECSEIEGKVEQLKKDSLALLKAKNKRSESDEEPMIRLGLLGLCGERVSAVSHYEIEVKKGIAEIERLKKRGGDFTGSAFVSFRSVASTTKAAFCRNEVVDEENWAFQNAPEPKDILWNNLFRVRSDAEHRTLELIASAMMTALIIFYAIPVAAGSALANIKELDERNDWLHGIAELPPGVIAIIEGFGPTIWRVVLMILVEPVLRSIIFYTGVYQQSELEMKFLSKFYMFLVVNIYVITLISSSVFETINEIVKKPLTSFELLAHSVPLVALDMIQYIALKGLSVQSAKIIRIPGLAMTGLFTSLASSDYERRKAMKPPLFAYGSSLAYAGLIWTLCTCYMAVAPLILPFGVLYFFLDYTIQKYNLLYVHVPEFETFGMFWPKLIRMMFQGLLIGQIALVIIVGLKFGYMQQSLLVPLPIITYLYGNFLDDSREYLLDDTGMALQNAVELDEKRSANEVTAYLMKEKSLKVWEHPAMRVDTYDPLKEVQELGVIGSEKRDDGDDADVKEADAKTRLLEDFELESGNKKNA